MSNIHRIARHITNGVVTTNSKGFYMAITSHNPIKILNRIKTCFSLIQGEKIIHLCLHL